MATNPRKHPDPDELEPWVTLPELCTLLSVKPGTVKTDRSRGSNPLFAKGFAPFGPAGGLRWVRSDVRTYMESLRQ
ncbi:hypothetical protein [Rhodococcus sp. IEGM 1330]|uniref:hypothetical protein n=1 Tax=Rhodococcus sp. IEGM 1330 TaxID=3082225 RepID=UPI002954949E|nr:hypothetical protein [Rhodococcus sp. IEGM 1330]MDV8024959.1 hypothetical protein [Rhodococcus sp. IEGM 1330]